MPRFSAGRSSISQSLLRSKFIIGSLLLCATVALLQPPNSIARQPTESSIDSTRVDRIESNRVNPARIRISWGGGTAKQWTGQINFGEMSIGHTTLLGLNPDTPGSIYKSEDGIVVQQLSPTTYSGFDVEVSGALDTTIQIEFFPINQPELKRQHQISLRDVFQSLVTVPLDEQDNRLSITRAPGDVIQVDMDREHLVFETGQEFQFDLKANWTPLAAGPAICKLSLLPARSSAGTFEVWEYSFPIDIDETGSSSSKPVSVEIPVDEGVYDLQIEISSTRGAATFLGRRKPEASRTIQFVALDNDLPNTDSDFNRPASGTSVEEIALISPRESQQPINRNQLSQISRLVGLSNSTPLANASRVIGTEQGELVELSVGGWQAIPLRIQDIQVPYAVEIEFPRDSEMATGISILQPDATGQIPLYGFDSGWVNPSVIIKPSSTKTEKGLGVHRFVFWPTSQNPLLLIANRDQNRVARFGTIRITRERALESGVPPNTAGDITPLRATRRMMAFYELPLFPENFGANELFEPNLQQPIDDWVTFYVGAQRLIHHLRSNGYQGAFINVASDGSAIYPSRRLEPTPKLDSGVFSSEGRDPIRKDVVELLFRMFDRSGLQLVPTLAFADTLPAVQSATRLTGASDAILVSYRNELAGDPNQFSLPRYNPLDPRVQNGVHEVIDELTRRYGKRASFDGIALICRPDTFTMLPGRQWGYDKATLQRFAGSLPVGTTDSQLGLQQLQSEILNSLYEAWLTWRAKQMSDWYAMLSETVASNSANGKLYLAPVDLFRSEEIAATLSPSLHRGSDVRDVMRRLGFDPETILKSSNLRMLKPHRVAPNHTLDSERAEFSLQKTSKLDHWFGEAIFRGDLFTHRASWAHFHQLEKQPQFTNQNLPLMRLQPLSPAGAMNRERFATALFKSDSQLFVDGGWLLSVGQEQSLSPLLRVFSKLPDQKFETLSQVDSTHTSSVAVRHYTDDQWTHFYIVNATPWPIRVTLPIDGAVSEQEIVSLSDEPFAISQMGSQRVIQTTVEPFGLAGGKSPAHRLKLGMYTYQFPDDAGHELRKAYYQLRSDLISSGKANSLPVLQNPGFEPFDNQSLVGWSIGDQEIGQFSFDARNAKEGTNSLIIRNATDQSTWIRSNDFLPSQTGRLSVSVWLKTDNVANQPPLRISVEGVGDGSSYYRFGTVGSLAGDQPLNQITSEWKRFAVHFDDLPVGIANLRIGFDMMGPGHVWIDQCEVYDRWFDENDVKAMTQLLASAGLLLERPGNIEQCRQILTGYWPTFLREYYGNQLVADSVTQQQQKLVSPSVRTSSIKQRFRRLVPPRIFQFR